VTGDSSPVGAPVRLTRLDQLWWPEQGIRKRGVVAYYEAVAPAPPSTPAGDLFAAALGSSQRLHAALARF
jgi:hypothetical protein